MERFKQYVISGDFNEHAEQGFGWLARFCWVIIFFAVIFFTPVFCHIFEVWTR